MNEFAPFKTLMDNLVVGITVTSWCPDDPPQAEWIFVNQARCRLSGHSLEELFAQPPVQRLTRETRAQFDHINQILRDQGHFSCESTLNHKSNVAIPVTLYMKLFNWEGETRLLIESHDIRSFKEAESQLTLSRKSMSEMLTLIEKEKQKISTNIKSNFGLVLFPLIDQLRITATDEQKEILEVMVNRITHIAREIGVGDTIDTFGVNLTKRQILICEMIRDGMTSKEIARVLGCTSSTINNHRNIIRRKLGVSGKSANLQAFLNSPAGGVGS